MSIPVSLNITNRHVCIVGGGTVAYRKANSYLKENAILQVIAIEYIEKFKNLDGIECIQKPFAWEDVNKDCFYIYAATNDEVLNKQILQEARKRHILYGCSMKFDESDILSMYYRKKDHLSIALSTHCPGADAMIYQRFFEYTEAEVQTLCRFLEALRTYLIQKEYSKSIVLDVIQILSKMHSSYSQKIINVIENNKTIIVLAYHGVADIKQEQNSLCGMEEKLHSEQYLALSVFFSDKVLQKAQQKGYAIASLQDIILLLDMLSIRYVIQPMLLQQGVMIRECLSQCKKSMVGAPLLDSVKDIEEVIMHMRQTYEGDLLGLYHPNETSLYQKIRNEHVMLLSLNEYSKAATLNKNKQITVLPFFLLYGYHAKKDIEQKWLPALWKQGIDAKLISKGLLSDKAIRTIFTRKIMVLCELFEHSF